LEYVVTFSSVPWAVGGGAVINEDVARMIPYFMFNKTEGVLGTTDLEVRALATPGGSVRIAPGGCVILGRGAGQFYEAYMGKNPSDHVVAIAPNNSASSRSDLLVVVAKDPYIAGSPWNIPSTRDIGPYIEPVIIQGVPSTIRTFRSLGNNWSAIDLARIDIPANTATITSGMIQSLRARVSAAPVQVPPVTVPKPVEEAAPDNPENVLFNLNPGPATSQDFTSSSQGTWRSWPAFASWTVSIPAWATTMDVQITLYSIFVNNDAYGETRVEVGGGEAFSQAVPFDVDPSGWERITVAAGGTVAIPSTIRGKNKTFKLGARSLIVDSSHTGTLKADRGSFARLEVQFKEQVS